MIFLIDMWCSPAVRSFVQGYLPALLLALILYMVPSIFFFLSRIEGHPSVSRQERKASSKMFSLLAGNIFLAAVLGGSLISISEAFTEDPKSIPRRLAEAVPTQVRIFSTLFKPLCLNPAWTWILFLWRTKMNGLMLSKVEDTRSVVLSILTNM